MGRIEPEACRDPERVFIAASLREARRVEELLTTRGVDYAVHVEPFAVTFLFRSTRHGAAFYVTSGQAAYCRSMLAAAGLSKGVVDEHE